MEFKRAALETERIEAVQAAHSLKATIATISNQDGDLNAAQATLVVAQTQALADIVAAQVNAEVEVPTV